MNIGDSPIVKIVVGFFSEVIKFFDNAYKDGWLLYLLFGLVAFFFLVVMFT